MEYSLPEISEIASAQKGILWCVVASFVLIVFPFAFLILTPFSLYFTYKIAKGLREKYLVLWMMGMFIPLISFLLLLILNGRATGAIKKGGFRVGLMGANTKELESKLPISSSISSSKF